MYFYKTSNIQLKTAQHVIKKKINDLGDSLMFF